MTNKLSSWFRYMWNKFDLAMYVLFITSVLLRLLLQDKHFVGARISYSLTLLMYYWRLMQTFFAAKNIGPKVIMIQKMMKDLLFFLCIFVLILLSFGVAYEANLYPNSAPSWYLLKSVLYIPYWQMYGELFLENMEAEEPGRPDDCTNDETIWRAKGGVDRCPEKNALVPILAVVYLILTNILLVNLLIAMFSNTFSKVQKRSQRFWKFYRYSLIHEYSDRPALFPPFIIIEHIIRFGMWIKSDRTTKEDTEFDINFEVKANDQLTKFEKQAGGIIIRREDYDTSESEDEDEDKDTDDEF